MSWSESDALEKVIKMITNGTNTTFIAKELSSHLEYHDHHNDWINEIKELNKFVCHAVGETGGKDE